MWEGLYSLSCVKVEKVLEVLMNPKCLPMAQSSFRALDSCTQLLPRRLKDVAQPLQAQCWKTDSTSLPFPPLLLLTPPKFYISQSSIRLLKTKASEPLLTPLTSSSPKPITFNILSPVHFSKLTPNQHQHYHSWISILVVFSLILSSSLLNSLSRVSNFPKIANLFMSLYSSKVTHSDTLSVNSLAWFWRT